MKNVALITGASTGIGKELAKIHAKKTGDLIIVARRTEKLNQLKLEIEKDFKREVLVITKDLSKPASAKELYDEVKAKGIEVEYLLNNAGFGGGGKFHEKEWQQNLDMINLNILALTALTRFFLPDFVKKNKGRILNTSSTASFMPGPLQAVYFATKAYVTFFSNAIAEELSDTNVTVTNLMPGATDTEFAKVADMENADLFKKMGGAYPVALDGYNGMLKGKLDVVSGLKFGQRAMMSFIPFLPKKIVLKQLRRMQEVK